MDALFREKVITAFDNYTKDYDISDPKIFLKVKHTRKVASLCEEIAQSLGMNDIDIDLAWLCGMLHDIGRFEQVKRYNTFFDSQSINHATFGADLLFLDGLFEKIVPTDCNAYTQKELIEKAIRVHNLFRLPEDLSDREYLFSTILRDADKIDILRANCETATEDVYNVTTEELKAAAVSEDVKIAFNERRCAKRHDRTTAVDFLVGHICLTFELVHKRSLELMYEQGNLFKLLAFESDNPSTNEWFAYMKEQMLEFFSGNSVE